MDRLGCPLCDSDLKDLPEEHPEYFRSLQVRDGNMRWFVCTNNDCAAVFVKDKQQGTWSYSPNTYTSLIKENIIKDRLA